MFPLAVYIELIMAIPGPDMIGTMPQESFGVTEPVSVTCATPREEHETEQMLSFLDSIAPAESEEGWRERWEVLIDLEQKVTDWLVLECGVSVPSESDSNLAICKVLTFGSFRLGIIRPSSDIDTIVLIPAEVSRERFFTDFITGILANDSDVTECLPVTDARVPVAKVQYRGIYLDILVASVPARTILAEMENVDDSLIFQVDEKCMKSMNGIRVADKIIRLVPDPKTFRDATRMIKCWAQRRCIYGNSIGYFGGVSWSMAVARVCQLYPNFCAKQIVERFFYTFANWPWEDNKAVVLCHPQDVRIPPALIRQGGMAVLTQFKDWNPVKYPSDRFQVMPVITPIFPSHNTTYNVTDTHKAIMMDEIKRGKELIQLMSLSGGEIGWAELCAPLPFWNLFDTFLELQITTAKADGTMAKFKGLVESRMRALIKAIEQLDRRVVARPHPDFFTTQIGAGGSFFIGLRSDVSLTSIDLKPAIAQFISENLEKSLQSPEWAEVASADSIRLEVRCTTTPFPAAPGVTILTRSASDTSIGDDSSVKRQRINEDMDDISVLGN